MKRILLALAVTLGLSGTCFGALHDIVTKDSTDRSVTIYVMDSSDGTPETSVSHDTAGIDLWYRREGAAVVSLTEAALAALTTAHTDGGVEPISHGYVRVDLPDAAFATGAEHVEFGGTITGMIVRGGRVRLVDFDLETATQAVNVTQIGGDAQSATDIKDFADAGYTPGTNSVLLVDTVTTNTDLVSAAAVVNEWETQSQADPTGFHVNVLEWKSAAADDPITLADINSEMDDVLDTAIPGAPTANSINQRLAAIDDLTQASGSGDLAAILVDTADMQPKFGTFVDMGTGTAIAQNLNDMAGGGYIGATDSLAALQAQGASILTDTGEIGAAGAGLTNIDLPNQTMDIVGNITGNLSGSVGSLTGHTVQTGDTYALAAGATGFAAIDTVVDAVLVDTAEIGAAGVGLTAITGSLPAAYTTGTADSGTTLTMVDAALTEADTDYWTGGWIRFTSGTISGQVRLITAFAPGTDTITFIPATTQAVSTNTYEILPNARVDIGRVNSTTVVGDGSTTPWGPE